LQVCEPLLSTFQRFSLLTPSHNITILLNLCIVFLFQILKKGELQVGEKERAFELDSTRREIASLVSTMCVDPTTGRPHTVGMIEKGMTEIGYSVKTNKNPKSMALDLIKQLQNGSSLKISRMQMRIRITMIAKEGKKVKDKVMELVEKVENEEWEEEWELVSLCWQFRLFCLFLFDLEVV